MQDHLLTLAEARQVYLTSHGLGDGGYAAPTVRVRVGWLSIDMPNTQARRRAVPLHDLHHVLTGYGTDWRGECVISGWEMGAGCGGYAAAWVLVLSAFGLGTLVYPLQTYRAFARGRGGSNLFREYPHGENPELLATTVGAMRARLGLDRPRTGRRLGTPIAFLLWTGIALVVMSLLGAALLVLGCCHVVAAGWRRRPVSTGA